MGLLDDAIREHLDLKRRRGADPGEVARMEQEALGPVRREPSAAEAAVDVAAKSQHDEPHADAAAEHRADAHHPDEHAHALPSEERHDPPHGDPLREQHAHDVELGGAAAEPADSVPSTLQPSPPEQTEQSEHADIVDQPTTEYHVEDHHDDEHEREDVLEETPDFLQETPEHDRLWFEQRPPRDFDFDG
jgi:hypothetical protein